MKNSKYGGFTYIEIVLSVFIVGVGLVSLVQLVSKGTRLSMDGRNEIIASQLAQEGIELIRNIRDNNRLHRQASFEGFGTAFVETCVDVTVDTNGDPMLTAGCSGYRLGFNNSSKEYFNLSLGGGSGIPTPFYRKIQISVLGNDRMVESIVWWGGGEPSPAMCIAGRKCVNTKSILTRWLEDVN